MKLFTNRKNMSLENSNENINIKILGSGCPKCNQLENNVKEALVSLNINASIEHVKDYREIAAYGVMSTPALVINNKVVAYGRVLRVLEITNILK